MELRELQAELKGWRRVEEYLAPSIEFCYSAYEFTTGENPQSEDFLPFVKMQLDSLRDRVYEKGELQDKVFQFFKVEHQTHFSTQMGWTRVFSTHSELLGSEFPQTGGVGTLELTNEGKRILEIYLDL